MIRACRECGDQDDDAYDDPCDFCAEVFNADCHHLVYDLCAACDAAQASAAAASPRNHAPTEDR